MILSKGDRDTPSACGHARVVRGDAVRSTSATFDQNRISSSDSELSRATGGRRVAHGTPVALQGIAQRGGAPADRVGSQPESFELLEAADQTRSARARDQAIVNSSRVTSRARARRISYSCLGPSSSVAISWARQRKPFAM